MFWSSSQIPNAHLTSPPLPFPPPEFYPLHLSMEEGIPSFPSTTMLRSNPPRVTDAHDDDDAYSTAIVPFTKATYIVQVPKDQVFRVPPPENARLAEEYRNKANAGGSSHSSIRLVIVFLVLLAIAIFCLCGVLIFYFAANPGVPHVSVHSIVVKNPTSSKPVFEIVMKAQNPSKSMDYRHKTGGKVELFHKGKKIASGDPPEFSIDHKDATEIKLSLRGSKATLPKEMVSSTTKRTTRDVFALSLSAEFPVKLGYGAFRTRRKELGIDCDLKMSKVGKEMHVKSQDCKAEFE